MPSSSSAGQNRDLSRLASMGVLLTMLAVAFNYGWRATHDLQWPYDYDLYRDSALAQNILECGFPADPYYADEESWYNPLGPALVAGVARISGLAPAQIYARHGAAFALVIPIAVFVLAGALLGRWAAIATTFAFLFLGPHDVPGWAAPSYSPWLFANLLSIAPFAFTVRAALRAYESGAVRAWVLCGILLGLTFLAHTASAIIAGCIAIVLASEPRKIGASVFRWNLILWPALIVSAPLLITILGHYHLHVQNAVGQNFIWPETDLQHLGDFLRGALDFRNALALIGLALLFRNRGMRRARWVLGTGLAVSALMFLYGYARQFWPTLNLPGLVPSFHWLFHLRLARTMLLGYAIYCGAAGLASFYSRWFKLPTLATLLAVLVALFFFEFRPFSQRHDFVQARDVALQYGSAPGFSETITWLRRETKSGAVILASPLDGLLMLGAAGRKTVALDPEFANPYVPFEPRATAAESMFVSLANHERDTFLDGCARYHVAYVLISSTSREFVEQCLSAPFITKVFTSGYYAVLRVDQEK